ncbi:MAG: hypothetical protein Q4A46_01920 [Clostridia bacterium]|nr:hypothetical protein [Clostridia bacterium]
MKKSEQKSKMISHILIMAMTLIMAVAATFSWLPRNPAASLGTGNMLKYTQSGEINGSGGEVHTYAGTNDNGVITYSDTELSSDSVTAAPGKVNYFKTVIQDNTTNKNKSVVSVYLENLKFSTDMGNAFHIGLTEPEKTYKSFNTTAQGEYNVIVSLCLEDNIIIQNGDAREIYWFISVDGNYSGNGTIVLDTMHLVYN